MNALIGDVVRFTATDGFAWGVLNLFGVNMIIWLAVWAALDLLLDDGAAGDRVRTLDRWVVGFALAASLLPTSTASVVALTMLALYVLQSAVVGSVLSRAGAIVLSITAALLWGRVLLAMFSQAFLRLDSVLVGLFGLKTSDNQVYFASDGGVLGPTFGIAPGCSSLHSISMALVFSTTVHGWLGIKPTRKTVLVGVLAALAVTFINTLRLAAIGYFPKYFEELHAGWIASLIAWTTIGVVIAIICLGMKREIKYKS